MFKPLEMVKVNLFLIKNDLDKVTSLFYDLKLIEFFEIKIEKFKKFENLNLNDLSSELLKLRSTITTLKKYFYHETKDYVDNPIEKYLELKKKIVDLTQKIEHEKDELKRVKILLSLKVTKNELDDKNKVLGFISLKNERYLKKLKRLNKNFKKFILKERIYFIADKKDVNFEYKEFYLPKNVNLKISSNLKQNEIKLNETIISLKKLANGNLRRLQKQELNLSKKISLIEVRDKFAVTENIAVLNGYLPIKDVKKLKRGLEETLVDKFQLDLIEADEQAPIKLNNSSSASNFETLLKMYSLPKYGEFDPTTLMFLVFPIFFGFILGDVFYGLISLIFFGFLKYKKPEFKSFISVLQLSSLVSIFFGFIFGEFMGFEPEHILGYSKGTFYGFLSRAHEADQLLIYAILFGVIHLNLGLIVGFINNIKNIKKAITDNLSWMILEFGIAFLYLGLTYNNSIVTYLGTGLSLFGMFLMYLGHGFIGIIEIPGFFTNILSYARLMAVGLSSVVIAMLVNEFSLKFAQGGVFGVIGGILLFSIGHIFNIILGNFEGFLHSLRLHYVEFFTKFYAGGGKEFEPFGTNIKEE